ncbi:HAMP domain-containing sensor histidine kinase [Streptococcus caprae]|uniref:histidine kinase n=1 Tax=Streptococcus caprae TaxID=1640501 RepID=A0ABV8CWA5_9STRE
MKTITRKHFVGLSATLGLVLIFFLAISYFTLPIYYNQTKKEELHQTFNQVLQSLQGKTRAEMVTQLKNDDKSYKEIYFTLASSDGTVFYPDEEALSNDSSNDENWLETDHTENGYWTETLETAEGTYIILTGQYIFPSLTTISQTLLTLYPFVILLFVVIAIAAAFFYSRWSTKRIRDLSMETRRLQELDKTLSCTVSGQDEISHLAEDINSLYARLMESIAELELENQHALEREQQKIAFLRMTSHELKTPITSMMGMIEGMRYNVGDFKDRDKYLEHCYEILKDQASLVQSILEASKLDLLLNPEQDQFSAKAMLEEILPTYQALAIVNQQEFSYDIEDFPITAHRLYLEKVIKNLLDNAFRYTKTGGHISLRLKAGQLIISNQAEHLLNDEQLQQIFEPFYRPDFSRNRQDGGTGLGLYIVDQILSKHGFPYQFTRQDNSMVFVIDFLKG